MGGSNGLLGGVTASLFGDGGASAAQAASAASIAASQDATDKSLALQKEMYYNNIALSQPTMDLSNSAMQQAFGNGQGGFDINKLNQFTTNDPFQYQDFNKGSDFTYNPLTAQAGQFQTNAPAAAKDFGYGQLGDIAGQTQAQAFNPNIDVTQDPSYQFRLQQGIGALDKSAASKGMLLSGAQQKAINNYAQDSASQQYQQAYQNNLTANQQNNAVGAQNYSQMTAQQQQQYAQALAAQQQNVAQGQNTFGNQLAANTQNLNNELGVQNQVYNQAVGAQGLNYQQNLGAYQQNQGNALTTYNSGVDLGTQRYNQLASVLGLGQTASGQLSQNNTNMAQMGTSTYGTNASNIASANAFNANAQMQSQMNNTSATLGLISAGTGAYKASDIRLKKNLVHVDTMKNGLKVYEFDYIWGEHSRGVMAQDVLGVAPEAVATMPNGYYAVDYSRIGE